MPPFEVLLAAMRDELAALDSEDAAAIEAATQAKLAALLSLRDSSDPTRADVEAAQTLNTLAASRTATFMARASRRLQSLAIAAGRPPSLTYGRDGRTSL